MGVTKTNRTHAFIMGFFTTSYITFTIIAINIGFVDNFLFLWLRTWFIAFLLVFPSLIFIAPILEKHLKKVNKIF